MSINTNKTEVVKISKTEDKIDRDRNRVRLKNNKMQQMKL